MSRVALAPSRQRRAVGAPLMVVFLGKRMPGAEDNTVRSAGAVTGQRYGARRLPADAGQPTGGGAAPGGLPPIGRGRPPPRSRALPSSPTGSGGTPTRQLRNLPSDTASQRPIWLRGWTAGAPKACP